MKLEDFVILCRLVIVVYTSFSNKSDERCIHTQLLSATIQTAILFREQYAVFRVLNCEISLPHMLEKHSSSVISLFISHYFV